MSKKTETQFKPVGQGVEVAIEGNVMTFRVDLTKTAPSASGKMLLAGSTGGWKDIGDGWRGNVMVGKYAPR